MFQKKLIVIFAGIAAGVVTMGVTLGGLAAGGVFNSTNNPPPTINDGGEKKEEQTNLLKAKVAIYNAFSKYAEGEIKNKK